ncbi:GTP-binding protein [Halobacteriales archaeon SW_5_70_135]|nr:MAG: GTP-binding protein [Halobacteriales archaeon SW_5_70_135]
MFEGRPDREAEVVLVGRSNVGKSTLMRDLTGHDVETGRRPGVTREPNFYDWASEDFLLTDLPGFGFMSGVSERERERTKTDVVRYLEAYAEEVLVGVLVVDASSAVEIIDRHSGPDSVPYDVEMFALLADLGVDRVVAANKIDAVDDRDGTLNDLCDRLGLLPPWQQWRDTVAPTSAKRGSTGALREAVRERLHEHRRDDLLQFF